jgi:enoyl-CoA hydratase/carnithine racemase
MINTRTLPPYVDYGPIRRWIESQEAEGDGDAAWHRVELWREMVEQHGVVKTSVEDRVGWIELCYPPKANALVPPMYGLLIEAVDRHAADDDVWVIVITGTGRSFSSGGYVGDDAFYAGLDAGHDGAKSEPIRRTFVELFQRIPLAIANSEKPVIAAVNGPVMAESLDIALTADLRTGNPNTEFRFSFVATGNTAYTGAAWSLPRLIGESRAKQFLLGAERVGAERAYEVGLLNHLFETEEFRERTAEVARSLASLPPITMRLVKKEIALGRGISSFAAALDTYSMIEPIVQSTEDHMDAENAVIEKRPPVVQGR